jgi:succinate-semialdehyde dehydrogenase/glutarate-semialdehyde dehydrogenase
MIDIQDLGLLRHQAFIDGEWINADNGKTFAVTNPADGSTLADVADCGAAETQRAIAAADAAWPAWRAKTAKERAAILQEWFRQILAHQDDLAVLMTAEQGKPLTEAKGEVVYAASFIEWFAEESKRVYGDTIPTQAPNRRYLVIKQPIGVVAAITPWNFPAAMITRKAAPALAAGCPVVIKPAKLTPLSALALAVLAERAGLPKGLLNVVTGSRSTAIGDELTASPIVRKLSFTGSTEIGKVLMRQSADTVKKLSLELGGNAPFIVFDDADLDAAVAGAIASKYRNTGQTCVCANRFFIQAGVYDAFAGKFAEAVAKLKVGPGLVAGNTQGPLIDMDAVEKVEHHIADAVTKGARLIIGGHRHALGGSFFEPTVLTGVTTDMLICREETFGPVAGLIRFASEDEAVRLANDTEYGLAAYFYARDIGRIVRVMEGLEYGLVGVNEGLLANEVVPFGGVKESGIGREGSKYGIEEFLEIKYVCLGGLDV